MRIKYSVPLYIVVPQIIGFLMLPVCLAALSLLTYLQCTEWTPIYVPAARATEIPQELLGVFKDRLYLTTNAGGVYCLEAHRMTHCDYHKYVSGANMSPEHTIPLLRALNDQPDLRRIMLVGSYGPRTYYRLRENGEIWACSTHFSAQLESLMKSPAVLWLILPLGIEIVCIVVFFDILLRHGQPYLRGFDGRGTRIK